MAATRRLRVNFQTGTLSAALVSSTTGSSVTVSSAAFASLPVVTSGTHHLPIILGPTTATPEIIWVTAHASNATTVTATRGMEGSSAPSWASGATWQHGPVASDFTTVCTSSTRPALASDGSDLPYQGQLIYESDTGKTLWYDVATTAWVEVDSAYGLAKGSIHAGTGTNTVGTLSVGSSGQVLTVDSTTSTGLKWATPASSTEISKTILTAKGDLIAASGASGPVRVGVGTDGQVLTASSSSTGGVAWANAPSTTTEVSKTTFDAKGDLLAGTGNDTYARVAAGTNGYVLSANSAQTAGVEWVDPTSSLIAKSTFTGKGQILSASTSGTPGVLSTTGVTAGSMLIYDSSQTLGIRWVDPTTISVAKSSYTASGDILLGTGPSSFITLPKGSTNDYVLTVDSTATSTAGVAWKALPGAGTYFQSADINAKGDLLVGTADNTYGRLPVGSDGYVLTASSTASAGVAWTASSATVQGSRPILLVAASGAPAAMRAAADYACDGVNDEVEIKAALDAIRAWQTAGTANGGEVVLSPGTFNISSADQISIPANTTLRGSGGGMNGSTYASLLKWSGAGPAASGAIIKIQGTASTNRINGARVQNLGIYGHDSQTSNLIGLSLKYANVCHISDVGFWACRRYGLYAYGWSDSVMERCRFDYCGTNDSSNRAALHIEDDDGVWANDNLSIRECWWEQCEDRCVTVAFSNITGNGAQFPYAITFNKCKFENTVGMRGGSSNAMVRISGVAVRVINCYFFIGGLQTDNSTNRLGAAVWFGSAYGAWVKDNQFSHNASNTSGASVDAFILFSGGTIEGPIITGNRFEGTTAATSGAIKFVGTCRQVYTSHNYYSYNSDNAQTRTVISGTPTSTLT